MERLSACRLLILFHQTVPGCVDYVTIRRARIKQCCTRNYMPAIMAKPVSLCSSSRPCTSTGMHRTPLATANRPVFAAPLPARGDRCKTAAINEIVQIAALEIDWTDPDVQIGVLGGVLGLGLGIGAPLFYSMRDDRDEERLEELRALNRATFKETGEYLTEVRAPRTPGGARCARTSSPAYTGGDCRHSATPLDRPQVRIATH